MSCSRSVATAGYSARRTLHVGPKYWCVKIGFTAVAARNRDGNITKKTNKGKLDDNMCKNYKIYRLLEDYTRPPRE